MGKHTDMYIDGVPSSLINTAQKEGIKQLIKENLKPKPFNTIYEAFLKKFGKNNISFIEGVSYANDGNYHHMNEINIDKVIEAAKYHDYILLCLGENTYTEKPGDLNDLNLHKLQLKLAKKLSSCGKPIILVLNLGRPRIISQIESDMSAIINIYLPGNTGADALLDVVSGDINPSGKLPYSYPAFPNALAPYFHKPSESLDWSQGAYDYSGKLVQLYPFGYGLSYSKFEYKDIKIEKDTINSNDTLNLFLTIKNTSDIDGKEIVQVYTSDSHASISPDNKRLSICYFSSGESKECNFKSQLAIYHLLILKINMLLKVVNLQSMLVEIPKINFP